MLKFFQEVLQISEASEVERDAAIQRFEFSFEAMWKATRHYLREVEGLKRTQPCVCHQLAWTPETRELANLCHQRCCRNLRYAT